MKHTLILKIFAVVIIILLAYFLWPREYDSAVIDDSDLDVPIVSVSDDQNIYSTLSLAVEKFEWTSESVNFEGVTESEMDLMIENNREALTLLSSALEMSEFQNPLITSQQSITPDLVLLPLRDIRNLFRVHSASLLQEATGYSVARSVTQMLKTLTMLHTMRNNSISTIEFLVYSVAYGERLQELEEFLNSLTEDTENLLEIRREVVATVSDQRNMEKGYVNLVKAEYQTTKNTAHAFAIGDDAYFSKDNLMTDYEALDDFFKQAQNPKHFQENTYLGWIARDARYIIEASSRDCLVDFTLPDSYGRVEGKHNKAAKKLYERIIALDVMRTVHEKKCEFIQNEKEILSRIER